MTVLSRGARTRRGGRGPGWPLLTALLVLAILASATLVFTNRVELLRLAVILSLWAAVMAAFVTVIYRRQSELDQARARDMKFVYDLQLDREISARREYELSVEAHLRRQLARELRAHSADEMAALRSELLSLRSQLEVLLGTDLGERPALQSDRVAVPMPAAPGRVESSRVTVVTEEVVAITAQSATVETEAVIESPIIDVPEEPLAAAEPPPQPAPPFMGAPAPTEPPPYPQRDYRGNHRRTAGEPEGVPAESAVGYQDPVAAPPRQPEAPWRPPEVRRGRHSTGDAVRQPQRPEPPAPPQVPRGRHWVGPGEPPSPAGRHRGAQEHAVPEPSPQSAPEPAEEPQGQHADGHSVADLMTRLQVKGASGGGGRRRRED